MEDEKMIPKEEQTFKDKWADFKAWCGRKRDTFSVWCGENKELVMLATPVIIGAGLDLIKTVIKSHANDRESELHDDYIYDRSSGHYYKIKHIRSDRKRNKAWLELDARRNMGQSVGEALQDMRLLK